jgi:hypothetical protein
LGSTVSIRVLLLCALVLGLSPITADPATAQAPPPELQVTAAVLAAPTDQQAEASVLGYDASGTLVTLRAGGNEMVCLADDPTDDSFSVACYHQSLEPYMARGRELTAQGTTDGATRNEIRWREAEAGTLAMPEAPATLYVLTGSGFDPESGAVQDAYLRYVIYTPWATLESTGLPSRPMGPGSPWLMYPGTAGAHIMISPPAPSGG